MIEDAHWADTPSLGLLRHLARAGGRMRVLVLATFREEELPDALAETLADLRRSDDIVRLRLGGLSTDEVEEFVRRAGGEPEELAGTINALTAGNAFLVCELWRSLADGGQLGTPESVREVVSRRVARLDAGTRDLLEVAATVGPEFGLEVVRLAAESALAPALEEAIATGMIEALPSRRLQYRFTHELVRRSLYDGLSPVRRAELHLRVGEALERAGPRSVADLAHHFAAAAPFGAVERALEYNVLAARAASAGLDFDAAAERLGVALELWVDGSAERARLLLELGTARHRAGRAVEAIAAFREAAEIAVELGDAELLAEAAIGYEAACWRPVITDEAAVTLLERAAASLADEPSELRVGVLAGLARALSIRGSHARGAAMREAAIAMAREVGDPTALAQVLVGSYWGRAVTPAEEVLAMLTEARDLAEAVGDVELYSEATSWRVSALVGVFDLEAAHREVGLVRMTAERTAQPFQLHVAEHCGSAIALCEGRLADAETMAVRSHEWSRMLTGRDASGVYGIQMFGVRREQGRLAELAPVVRMLAGGLGGGGGAWRPGLVSLLAELGMEAEARRELANAHRRRPGPVPRLPLARRPELPDRRLRRAGRRGDGGAAVPRAGAVRGLEPDDRAHRRVPRRRGPAPGDARGDARRVGAGGGALRAGARAQPRDGCAHVGRAHRVRVRADAAATRRSTRSAAQLGEAAALARALRDGGAARPDPGAGRRIACCRESARRPLAPRGAGPRADRRRPEQPGDRHDALHLRAHGRQPRPQHPAQDGLREPDRSRLLCPSPGPGVGSAACRCT